MLLTLILNHVFACILSEAQINIALYYLLDFGAPIGVPWKEGL